MGKVSDIEYCDSTANAQMGCDGCELWIESDDPEVENKTCYAGTLTEIYGGRKGWPDSFTRPKLFLERIERACNWPDLTGSIRPDKPHLNGYPRVIFWDDMGDTWTESLPLDWLAPYVERIARSPHINLFLTKRPKRMYKFFADVVGHVPKNFWLGVSITGPGKIGRFHDLARLKEKFPFTVTWLSVEPISELTVLPDNLRMVSGSRPGHLHPQRVADWCVFGGPSGAGAPAVHPDVFRTILRWSLGGGAAPFFKQWGEWVPRTWGEVIELPPPDGSSRLGCFRDGRFAVGMTGSDLQNMARVGKKNAGSSLDGRQWRQFPQAPEVAAQCARS